MNENFESIGVWYLPNFEDHKLHGTISYTREEGIHFTIHGKFENLDQTFPTTSPDRSIILGTLENGKIVTLIMNSISSQMTYFNGGMSHTKYICRYMLIGVHYNNIEEILFNEISVRFYNLKKWINRSGRNFSMDENYNFNLTYSTPKSIKYQVKDYKISFQFINTLTEKDFHKISFKEDVILNISSDKKLNTDQLLRETSSFQSLLTFGTFESSHPLSVILNSCEKKTYDSIELFYRERYTTPRKDNDFHKFLFTYDDVKDNFQSIINNWYTYEIDIKPIIYLFINSFYNENRYFSEYTFLEIIHALEAFDRRIFNERNYNKEEHKKRMNNIIEAIPEEHKAWVKDKLQYSYEPSLHSRLENLISKVSEFGIINNDITDFIKHTKNSRNYYTHYEKRLEKNSLKGRELYQLSIKLRLILTAHLLLLIGVEKEKIRTLINKISNQSYPFLFN